MEVVSASRKRRDTDGGESVTLVVRTLLLLILNNFDFFIKSWDSIQVLKKKDLFLEKRFFKYFAFLAYKILKHDLSFLKHYFSEKILFNLMKRIFLYRGHLERSGRDHPLKLTR